VRIRLLNVVLLAALVFAISRLWLFLGEPPPSLPAINAGATPSAVPATKREQNAEVAELPPAAYDVIVARDLFSPTRGVVPPAPTAATKPASKPLPAPKLTLYGVVIIDGEKTAYLQEGTQEGRPRKVRENEHFAGGVVKTIRPDGITFLFSGSEITVPLRTPKFGAEALSARGQAPGGSAPRPGTPVAFPRRQLPTGRQLPAPGSPATATHAMPPAFPGMPPVIPPVEFGGEGMGEEGFPEGATPEGEVPDMTEEATTE